MNLSSEKRWLWFAFIVVSGVGSYLAFRHEPLPLLFEHSDKIVHFFGFFIISLILLKLSVLSIVSVFVLLTIVSFGTEFIQMMELLPKRQADWWDLLANFIGITLGLSFMYVVEFFKKISLINIE